MTARQLWDRLTTGPVAFFTAILLAGIIIVPVGFLLNKAFAVCTTPDGTDCSSPPALAQSFRDGKRGHTAAAVKIFPPAVKAEIIRQLRPLVQQRTGRASSPLQDAINWNNFLDDVTCGVASSASYGAFNCAVASKVTGVDQVEMNGRLKRTVKVEVVCGTAAAVGMFKGGGAWGAGLGGGVCLWTKYVDHL